ncbi:hypothetical protein G9A89_004660 [Geosiphon pyriformis]|nr:hypothetical protein G9A89_004660 [Geosiphon pyriformis]
MRVDSVYSRSFSFKKPNKPGASGLIVDLLTGSLSAEIEMESEKSSMSKVLNIKNLKNTIAKETSYVDSNTSETDDIMDDTTLRKMQTRTYVLGQLPKVSSFVNANNNNNKLVLPVSKFVRFNWLLSAESYVLEKRNFKPVKLFALDVELFALSFTSEKSLIKAREMVISEKILVNNNLKKVNSCSDWEVIVKKIPVDLFRSVVKSALVKFESSEMLMFMKKDSVHIALTNENKQTWVFKDQHQALLYTLPVGIMAHDLFVLVRTYDKKTCFIGHNPASYIFQECKFALGWSLSGVCSVGENSGVCGKQMPIAYPVFFGGKTWAQVVNSSPFYVSLSVLSGIGLSSSAKHFLMISVPLDVLLVLKKLSSLNLVPLAPSPVASSLINFVLLDFNLGLNMVLDDTLESGASVPLFDVGMVANLSSSNSRVLISKVGGLESKMVVLKVSVNLVLVRLDQLIATCNVRGINNPAKQNDIIHWHKEKDNLVSIFTESKLKEKAGNINSLIAKAVNESFFVILRGDFNENGSCRCASFKKCLDFGLVNALGIVKTINYVLISLNLVNTVVDHGVFGVREYFDTDYQTVSMLVSLGGLLDVQLNSVYKQANKDSKFKNDTAANAAMFHDDFLAARMHSDLDAMWVVLYKVLCLSAKAVFKRKWFKDYDYVFVKKLSKFHKLELLESKLVKASCLNSFREFTSLLDKWKSLDLVNASIMKSFFLLSSSFDAIQSVLFKVRKSYCSSKMSEVECVKESRIRLTIDKKIKSFELNKSYTIRSVLECPFCKVTLDHLVIDDKLVLEPDLVRTKPLEYVFNDAFSGVMCSIDFDKMSSVISNLSDGKVADLSSILNKLWKHYDRLVLDMLLVLLNFCLECESVSGPWKET